jgi:hypothetical protein
VISLNVQAMRTAAADTDLVARIEQYDNVRSMTGPPNFESPAPLVPCLALDGQPTVHPAAWLRHGCEL